MIANHTEPTPTIARFAHADHDSSYCLLPTHTDGWIQTEPAFSSPLWLGDLRPCHAALSYLASLHLFASFHDLSESYRPAA